MLNIVIPMAGAGSRFSSAGYKDPKPLIQINGTPMIHLVIQNLRPKTPHRFIFICQRTHVRAYGLIEKLNAWSPGCEIIEIDGLTEGAACTVLAAKKFINSSVPLMIANSDQYVDTDINKYLNKIESEDIDGLVMTMRASDPKWSFVGLDKNNLITHIVEKKAISQEATVGIYNFKKGEDFVVGAEESIARNLRVNGEFYVAPVYNILIEKGAKVGVYNIGSDEKGMYGLGTPHDLERFIKLNMLSTHKQAER
jgi:dTDP-glucose pyrophosphorylase